MAAGRGPGPVVVGVGALPADTAVLEAAATEAVAHGRDLVVVHAVAWDATDARLAAARRRTEAAAGQLRAVWPPLRVSVEVARGDPVAVLLAHCRAGRMLMVGHHRRPVRTRRGRRSVALCLVAATPVPLIVHRGPEHRPVVEHRPVLVGAAGPAGDGAALAFAFTEASARGVGLAAEYVARRETASGAAGADPGAPVADARTALLRAVTPWATRFPQVAVRPVVRRSLDAAVTLTAAARAAQLVVVGGPADPGAFLSRALVDRADCPVAVVPAPATDPSTVDGKQSRGGDRHACT